VECDKRTARIGCATNIHFRLSVVTLLACYTPARRAMRVDRWLRFAMNRLAVRRAQGSVNATSASLNFSSVIFGCPPAATTQILLSIPSQPVGHRHGVCASRKLRFPKFLASFDIEAADAGVGRAGDEHHPAAVTMGPPRLIDPAGICCLCTPPKILH